MPGPKAPSSRRKGADLGWTLGVRCPGLSGGEVLPTQSTIQPIR